MGVFKIEAQSKNESFTGWIYEEETGISYGIVKKQNKTGYEIKYLIGTFVSEKWGRQRFEAYEMSNTPGENPIKYVVPNTKRKKCEVLTEYPFSEKKIKMKLIKDSDKKRRHIERLFENLDMETNDNGNLIFGMLPYRE